MTAAEMARVHAAAFTVPRPWSEAEIAACIADPLGIVVTESPGFLLGRVVAGEAELLTLAVAPQSLRRGIGRRLVMAFVGQARGKGAETIFLEVAESNHAARSLYERCGFSLRGSRKNYYRDAAGRCENALIMVLEI